MADGLGVGMGWGGELGVWMTGIVRCTCSGEVAKVSNSTDVPVVLA
jgi:hypothetical protein